MQVTNGAIVLGRDDIQFAGTKEFDEMQTQFERDMKTYPHIRVPRLDRTDREDPSYKKGEFYENGETNQIFHAYMLGYQLGKSC